LSGIASATAAFLFLFFTAAYTVGALNTITINPSIRPKIGGLVVSQSEDGCSLEQGQDRVLLGPGSTAGGAVPAHPANSESHPSAPEIRYTKAPQAFGLAHRCPGNFAFPLPQTQMNPQRSLSTASMAHDDKHSTMDVWIEMADMISLFA
jgi:hypothetical protein